MPIERLNIDPPAAPLERKIIEARPAFLDFHNELLGGSDPHPPSLVDLVALGESSRQYVLHGLRKGEGHQQAEQVWTVNRGARVFAHDLVFVMDDLRGEFQVDPEYGQFLSFHDKPIVTSTPYHDWPRALAYPIGLVRQVVGDKNLYFHNSVPYVIAYALLLGVQELRIWGADYTLPHGQVLESGRANVEYWIGFARAMGMDVAVPITSTLLGLREHGGSPWFYGYKNHQLPLDLETPPGSSAAAPRRGQGGADSEKNSVPHE